LQLEQEKPLSSSCGVKHFFPREMVTFSMSAMKFRKGMIDSVGHNSVPLSYFSKPAFQSLNGEMA